jgi:RNA polymerase sigma-70 factor (ECF subfamily)
MSDPVPAAFSSVAALASDDNAPSSAPADDGTSALTAGLRRGDEAAYRRFFHDYHRRLARYCLALTAGDAAEADDVLQKTYLRVARYLRPLPDAGALWRWLANAARCAAIDASRKRSRHQFLLGRWKDWLQVNGHTHHTAPSDLDHMLSEALANALDALPEDSHTIVHAKYFDELPITRIAEHLNLTEKAVERKLARARARLRRDIQQQLESSRQ